MRESASVNLWELITTVASKDLPNSDKCQGIKSIKCPGFGSELSLQIDNFGNWTIEVFDHEDSGRKITLVIQSSGHVTLTRLRPNNDLMDSRTVWF